MHTSGSGIICDSHAIASLLQHARGPCMLKQASLQAALPALAWTSEDPGAYLHPMSNPDQLQRCQPVM